MPPDDEKVPTDQREPLDDHAMLATWYGILPVALARCCE